MKKIFLLGAAAVLSAFTAYSQCDEGGSLFGDAPAPCSETPPVSVDIAAFEVWRGDLYEITDVQAGASYTVDICQSALPGGGGSAWDASLTLVAPSGAIDAFGLDAGSLCELTFTASEDGVYQMFVNEVGECPGVSQDVDNGSPRVTYNGGGTCPDPVTACEAGVNNGVDVASICPGEITTLNIDGMIIPNTPTQGDGFIEFTPTDPLNTSGLGGQFVLTGFSAADLAAYSFDNDLNGVLSANLFPVLEGEWTIKGFVTSVAGTYFDPLTRCDSTDAVATVTFLTSADAGCEPVTACEAGTLDQAGIDSELCPGEATDYSLTGVTIPNSPLAGQYTLVFEPVPGSGAGGPFGGNPDPSFFLTLNGIVAGDENVDAVVSIDAELLTTGAAQPAMTGEWTISGGILTDVDPVTEEPIFCDVVPSVVINFKGADEFPCGGDAPCENPYPAVDQESLSVVENANGSITFTWDPIPGQIGCIVGVRVGPPGPTAAFTRVGANASSFTVAAVQLEPYVFSTIGFRVRCGCQQAPAIVGPFTDYEEIFYGLGSGITTQMTPNAAEKLAIGNTLKTANRIVSLNDGTETTGSTFNLSGAANATISKFKSSLESSLDVFPNPTAGNVNLNYTATKDGVINVRVFDVVGKAVADFNFTVNEGSNFLNLDISSFDKGIYVIEVLEGQKSTTSKVVLK